MNGARELAHRIAALEAQARDKSPQLAYSAIEGGAITEFDSMGNVVASYGTQFDGSHIAMSFVGITPLKPTPAVVTPGPGELTIEWLGTWVDNGICPSDFTRLEVHVSEVSGDAADTATTLYDTIETPRGAVVSVRLPAGVTYYVRFVARNLAGQRGPASDEVAGVPGAIIDQGQLDAMQAEIDGIPADIAAAKQEAIDSAALDASAKATQAEQDAIAAAAADAQAKADAAEADAVAAAALDAQQRADLAEADAIAASIPRTAGAVTSTYIAADAVTTPKILAGSVTTVKLDALAVTADKIAANAIVAGKIAADAVTSSTILAGAITAGKLAAASVIAGNIAADAVTANTIVAGAISADKLAVDSVTAIKILAGSVVADKIATDAVTAVKILAGAVTTAKLDALAVTADKVAANAIIADKIAAGAVTAGKLTTGAVIAGNIAAGAVTSDTIVAGAIKTRHLTLGDTSNLAEINEFESIGALWSGYDHTISVQGDGSRWSGRSTSTDDYFMFRRSTGPVPFHQGEKLRLTFDLITDVGFTFYVDMHLYDSAGGYLTSVPLDSAGVTSFTANGSWAVNSYAMTSAVVPASAAQAVTWTFGLRGVTGKNILVRNVQMRVMNAGRLVVDGSIDGITITGSTIQTAWSGPRVVIQPTPLQGDAGKIEWWDDHVATGITYDAPPGVNGLVSEFTSNHERYTLSMSSGVLHKADNLGGSAYINLESRRTDGDPSRIYLEADRVFSMGVYNSTSTFTANVGIGTGIPLGRFYRLTSSARYKVGMRPEAISEDAILKLVPKSYIDRRQFEENGSKVDGLQRYLGLIAEEVAEIPELAPHLVTMNEKGTPEAVSYDRVGVVLIPVIQDLIRRIRILEGKPVAPPSAR